MSEIESYDVVVIGTGAGGLATAITATKLGLSVLLLEKEGCFGGTSALSGGWLWIPCNPLAINAGIRDSTDAARLYIQQETQTRFDPARVEAYLSNGPSMLEFFIRETQARFFLGAAYPDYHPELAGASVGGRAICTEPFNGRRLGKNIFNLRRPPYEMTIFGLKVGSGPDLAHFANANRSIKSAIYVFGRMIGYLRDRLTHGFGVKLMGGNALIARLAVTAFELKIPMWLRCRAEGVIREHGAVVGVKVARDGSEVVVRARRGVVCAAGGFPHDFERRENLYRHRPKRNQHFSLTSKGNTGDGLRIAEEVGGQVEDRYADAAAWIPVSRVPLGDGEYGTFPHSWDRAKPGVIAVNPEGKRFANESNSYHDVVQAMVQDRPLGSDIHAFFVCDHRFIRRYGLGYVKPFPIPLRQFLDSGYLYKGDTLHELASKAGIDPTQLSKTVERFNSFARKGVDPDFARGGNVYNRCLGDAGHAPNPNLAPIERAPFYAVKVYPGDMATFAGLRTDEKARVLDKKGKPIPGLYAVGTDMASVFGGSYPGPGANLGPAMTFGFIAAHDLAGVSWPNAINGSRSRQVSR